MVGCKQCESMDPSYFVSTVCFGCSGRMLCVIFVIHFSTKIVVVKIKESPE